MLLKITIRVKKFFLNLALIFSLSSCWQKDPSGVYSGEIKDWIYEVFEAPVVTQGHECKIEVVLRQVPEGFLSELTFIHPKMSKVVRKGKWKVEDGYRSVFFEDGKTPSEYFLIKTGARFTFQTKDGLSDDEGNPVLLMRNEGKSRKASYPFKISFLDGNLVQIDGQREGGDYFGEWKWAGEQISVQVSLDKRNKKNNEETEETYKYFFKWDKGKGENLSLEKMLIIRPFVNKDGSRRQSWMSSLVFTDRPILKPM